MKEQAPADSFRPRDIRDLFKRREIDASEAEAFFKETHGKGRAQVDRRTGKFQLIQND